jgi:hypothetical protein
MMCEIPDLLTTRARLTQKAEMNDLIKCYAQTLDEVFVPSFSPSYNCYMKPTSFFIEEEDPAWDMNGDPWSESRFRSVLDTALLDRLRSKPQDDIDEVEVAYALAQLAHDELSAYGTDGRQKLGNEEITMVLRTLRAVLKRINILFDPPFRDFQGFMATGAITA